MSGSDNPYSGSFGNQMTATTSFGAAPDPAAAAGSYITDTTTANFGKDVIEESRKQPVLVDFWAPWCGPCRSMAPFYVQATKTLEPAFRVVKVNTEASPDLGSRFNIRSIPTLALFRRGVEVARQPGAINANAIVAWARDKARL